MFSFDQLSKLRLTEIDAIARALPPKSDVLEIGAGTGHQAQALASLGHKVTAIDVEDPHSAEYADHRVYDVQIFTPGELPFADNSFDVIFTSNVLEHVPELDELAEEVKRVLRPNGICIHILPTQSWRLWTSIAAVPSSMQHLLTGEFYKAAKVIGAALLLVPHGERGNAASELVTFRPSWWAKTFKRQGFTVKTSQSVGLFYTGEMVLGARLPFEARRRLARVIGSATHAFVLGK